MKECSNKSSIHEGDNVLLLLKIFEVLIQLYQHRCVLFTLASLI